METIAIFVITTGLGVAATLGIATLSACIAIRKANEQLED